MEGGDLGVEALIVVEVEMVGQCLDLAVPSVHTMVCHGQAVYSCK